VEKQIEENLEKTRIRVSNPKEVLEYVSMLSSKLASTWISSAHNEKQILQKMLFPKGLSYHRENDEYLTTRPNRVFQLIAQLTGDSEENKSRVSSFFLANSGLVQWCGTLSNQLADSLSKYEQLKTSKDKNEHY